MLPGMDGLEVCRRLRANPLLAEVPIIMVTALDDRDTRLQGIIAGADDFISKRFDGTELRARVRTITRLNRYRRLMRERAKFERMVELMPNGLLLADAAGTISLVNSAMLKLLKIDRREDVLGQNMLQLLDPSQRAIFAAELERAVADKLRRRSSRRSFCTPEALSQLRSILGISSGTMSRWPTWWCAISLTAVGWSSNCFRRRRWRALGGWPAVWRTISITC